MFWRGQSANTYLLWQVTHPRMQYLGFGNADGIHHSSSVHSSCCTINSVVGNNFLRATRWRQHLLFKSLKRTNPRRARCIKATSKNRVHYKPQGLRPLSGIMKAETEMRLISNRTSHWLFCIKKTSNERQCSLDCKRIRSGKVTIWLFTWDEVW